MTRLVERIHADAPVPIRRVTRDIPERIQVRYRRAKLFHLLIVTHTTSRLLCFSRRFTG